jgi:hypothetical protein
VDAAVVGVVVLEDVAVLDARRLLVVELDQRANEGREEAGVRGNALGVATASPVGRCSAQSASPPSTAIGDAETRQPTAQAVLQMFRRMCQTDSYLPVLGLAPQFLEAEQEAVSWNRRSLRLSRLYRPLGGCCHPGLLSRRKMRFHRVWRASRAAGRASCSGPRSQDAADLVAGRSSSIS